MNGGGFRERVRRAEEVLQGRVRRGRQGVLRLTYWSCEGVLGWLGNEVRLNDALGCCERRDGVVTWKRENQSGFYTKKFVTTSTKEKQQVACLYSRTLSGLCLE